MENKQRFNGHTISRLTAHIVWVTKYRYKVLDGDIKVRCRTLIKEICMTEDVTILSGVVSSDHIHLHIEYLPSKSISDLVKKLKGRTSRRIQEEFSHISKKYRGRHFWAIGYGVWSTGNITDEMVQNYLEHHRKPENNDNDNIILE
ncbi:MAG: IS200/IS605 family transposase [Paludibacteraceae bacterium]